MSRWDHAPQTGWKPPRWLFSVIAILIVAWWVSTQPLPQAARPTAPPSDQNARFEPSIEVVPGTSAAGDHNSRRTESADDQADLPEVAPGTRSGGPKAATSSANDRLIVKNVTIKDQSGRVALQGDVNLHPTFDRIERGEKFAHKNDGSTFRNLERRLPQKPAGYYTEYVHPTPGLNGPGPQRIIIGKEGEAYYTHDHYNSFRKVRG